MLSEPTWSEIKFFHSHFKFPLKDRDDIINFYKQLRAQGRPYNLHLIDLNDIKENVDLCPLGTPASIREKMALAIYQKLQDVDLGATRFMELKNQLELHATTCDGMYIPIYSKKLIPLHPNSQSATMTFMYMVTLWMISSLAKQ